MMTRRIPGTRGTPPRVVLLLAVLLPACAALSAGAAAAPRDDGPQEREEQSEALVDELSRALGMTAAEIEALELSPAEMRSLIAGFTEETVVVGSRAEPRSVTESAVPVDVLTATDLVSQGSGDLKDQLRTIIPSFSTNTQPISGGSTVVRPAMLRNLAPDHTLVLINGPPGKSCKSHTVNDFLALSNSASLVESLFLNGNPRGCRTRPRTATDPRTRGRIWAFALRVLAASDGRRRGWHRVLSLRFRLLRDAAVPANRRRGT